MRISMIGTGYVGLVSGTCFAELGHHVTCIDIDPSKIETLNRGFCPLYEPGLEEMIKRNISLKRLHFSLDYRSIGESQVVFLCVGTPSNNDGSADLSYLFQATRELAPLMAENAVLVIKSTVPVGTHRQIMNILKEESAQSIHVVNNPEFLKEGSAIDDFMRPDRIVVGVNAEKAEADMRELYEPLTGLGHSLFVMSNISAEMTKYAANSFLATKISFINEIARLCDATGARVSEVLQGITSDQRIGHQFLYPGIGYGGSCFPKDVQALIKTGEEYDVEQSIIKSAHLSNLKQKKYLVEKIKKHFKNDLKDKTFGFWGVSFKPNTDDIREAPSIEMAKELLKLGAKIKYFDPAGASHFQALFKEENNLEKCQDQYEVLEGSDALVLVTEWDTFKTPDFSMVKSQLKNPIIFDGRNIYPAKKLRGLGFTYFSVGNDVS